MRRRTTRIALALMALLLAAPEAGAQVLMSRKGDGRVVITNDGVGSGWRVNGHAPSDSYLVSRRNAVTPFDDLMKRHAGEQGVDPMLVKCVMLIESNFNPRAVSRKGARGLMQLMPATARQYGVRDLHEPEQNIRGGVAYLADMLDMFRGSVPLALAAYNAGPNAVVKYGGVPPYAETQEYIRRFMTAYEGQATLPRLGGGFLGSAIGPSWSRSRPGPPVQILVADGSRTLSNSGPLARPKPLLGRVAPEDEPSAAAAILRPGGPGEGASGAAAGALRRPPGP